MMRGLLALGLWLWAVGAQATVTYHIINLGTTNKDESSVYHRIEAMKCTSDGATVYLPDAYRSPLAKNFKYWTTVTTTPNVRANYPSPITYTAYSNFSDELAESSAVGSVTDIYVTYEYDDTKGTDLNGGTKYNIELDDYFLAYNFTRNDRPAAVKKSSVTSQYLISDEAVTISGSRYYFLWYFKGQDPYNVTIASAYDGTDTSKHNSQLFSRFGYNMWLTEPSKKLSISDMNKDLYNSFIILERSGSRVYMAANMTEFATAGYRAPNASGQYAWLSVNGGTNPQAKFKAESEVDVSVPDKIELYRYHVKSKTSGTEVTAVGNWSQYARENDPTAPLSSSLVPDALRRKYCSFTKFYSDAAMTSEITTFSAAYAADDGTGDGYIDLWVDYEVTGMPFLTSTDYTTARWYNIRKNGGSKYVKYNGSSRFEATGTVNTEKEGYFAFFGDPYELKVVYRKGTEDNSSTRFVGVSSGSGDATAMSFLAAGSDIYTWEIPDDTKDGFSLRQFNTATNPGYWSWDDNAAVSFSTSATAATATRIMVYALPQFNYTYYVVNNSGAIAVKATATQDIYTPLSISTMPANIVSPFLALPGAVVKFWTAQPSAISDADDITETPAANSNVYVKYDVSTPLASAALPIKLNSTDVFNVRLNEQYIYYDGGLKSQTAAPADADDPKYQWRLEGGDPYAMQIYNVSTSSYVTLATVADDQNLSFSATPTLFIAKSSTSTGAYEVMVATGSGTDAASTYYNIGRSADNTIKVYSNSSYSHGSSQLRFELTSTSASVTYHLIDRSNTELLQLSSRNVQLALPAEYQSPLVSSYHYYASTGDYTYNSTTKTHATADGHAEITEVGTHTDIYVTYDVNDLISYGSPGSGTMYMLKFANGSSFHQENGSDALRDDLRKAVYPYANGDCNFYVYGEEELLRQQSSAASTRTRWAWYAESDNSDPYHVKICSRQKQGDGNMYFRTYIPVDYTGHVVTGLIMPYCLANYDRQFGAETAADKTARDGRQVATEYMVVGSAGAYKLLTTYAVEDHDGDASNNTRQYVTSFEQYWKTYDTVKKKILGVTTADNSDDYPTVPTTPASYRTTLASAPYNWHSYNSWGYAKRWNGYNIDLNKSKGFEYIEHWFETIDMGDGTFDFEVISIDPVLVLLDQHGWEIMRKPIPVSASEAQASKDAKYAAIRPYNSPMVKAYKFYNAATKATGYHRYTVSEDDRIKTSGADYTSTDLTQLPPYLSDNNRDNRGNVLDQYVTYDVLEEYAQSYNADTQAASEFLIQQGTGYATTTDGATITPVALPSGGLSALILGGSFGNTAKWKLKPNTAIDAEMGYTGDPIEYTATENGFDPYNLQIESVSNSGKFFTTNSTGVSLSEGSMVSTYSGDKTVTLTDLTGTPVSGSGYDGTTLHVTNGTFMAVQDANGNMRLTPRFDHGFCATGFTRLAVRGTNAPANDDGSNSEQTTIVMQPNTITYIIVDNGGLESLRYRKGGDSYPAIPDHFKSPLATNYTFYKNLETSDGHYVLTDIEDKLIDGSFADAGLTGTENNVYVRYDYDEEAEEDHSQLLQGKWVTLKLNGADVKYDSSKDGCKMVTDTKPGTVDATAATRVWQWKLREGPWAAPDPYAVKLYSRSKTDGPVVTTTFALLNHPNGGYALAEGGLGGTTYKFLNGAAMTGSTPATTVEATGFTSVAGTLPDAAEVTITDDVDHTYIYKVVTNSGKWALDGTQGRDAAASYHYVPSLPLEAQSPVLNDDQYTYYVSATGSDAGGYAVDDATATTTLLGLYEDVVYVRYAYDLDRNPFMVPNSRNAVDAGQIARGNDSHDAVFDIGGTLWYNVIWASDNMMYYDGSALADDGNKQLTGDDNHLWEFTNSDPYELYIKTKSSTGYLYSSSIPGTCNLSASAEQKTPFMLLKKDGYDYGVLAVTGSSGNKLNGPMGTISTTETPTKFIPFSLSTLNVFYQLVIATKDATVTIPYRAEVSGTETTKTVTGYTMRDLTGYVRAYTSDDSYHYDAGRMSLGDWFVVPASLERPYCTYEFYVDNIKDGASEDAGLNAKYRGLKVTQMWADKDLFNKKVYINLVYTPDAISDTDASLTKQWYTLETSDATPWLANYTYQQAKMASVQGRDKHFTNDFLWSGIGDNYGFELHNRYVTLNGGETTKVMNTENSTPAAGDELRMGTSGAANTIFEMLASETAGFFKIHPVANTDGTLFVNNADGTMTLSTTGTDWRYGLSAAQFKPYFEHSGYPGALTATAHSSNADLATAVLNGTADHAQLLTAQTVCYDPSNIQHLETGYYRIHDLAATPNYISGYTHAVEQTGAINLHCHEQATGTVKSTYGDLAAGTYEVTNGTRGAIPLETAITDASSIFRVVPAAGTPATLTLGTQGLYVNSKTGGTQMSASPESLPWMEIGGGVVVMRKNGAGMTTGYLAPDDTKTYTVTTGTDNELADNTKWCLQPVGSATHQMAFRVTGNSGGDGKYYATLCVPFDVMLPATATAYVCSSWNTDMLHPTPVSGSDGRLVTAGTPVILRSTAANIDMTLPNATPSDAGSSIFSGLYLEQKLATNANVVYSFGLPITGVTMVTDTESESYGNVTGYATQASTGVGFYVNANPNKEASASKGGWTRNNLYVYHNKIYYRASGGSPAPTRGVEFVPVVFDAEGGQGDGDASASWNATGDNCIYDLQGRKVATASQVGDGSWRTLLAPGIYILNGRKFNHRRTL